MSRIEEALKRASAAEPASAFGGLASTTSAGPVTLEDYPGELRSHAGAGAKLTPTAPLVDPAEASHRGTAAWSNKLVLGSDVNPVAVEEYRRVAAMVHDLQTEKGLKTILVTSALPRDGKTLTAANLALTLSEAYRRRVLLIDADLRRPTLHDVLGIANQRGLRDGLRAPGGALPLVQVSPLLTVLPAGQPDPNPIAGLASDRMRALLAECAGAFDWVLLDAPPVMMLPDAGLLSKLVDGVIFVIAAAATPSPMVERAVAELGRDCIIGTVLNRVEERSIPATGYYHQYYERRSSAG